MTRVDRHASREYDLWQGGRSKTHLSTVDLFPAGRKS